MYTNKYMILSGNPVDGLEVCGDETGMPFPTRIDAIKAAAGWFGTDPHWIVQVSAMTSDTGGVDLSLIFDT